MTGNDNVAGKIEIKFVQDFQFGSGDRAHNLLRCGYFVSGTCKSEVYQEALSLLRGFTEKCISTRSEATKESDTGSSFAENMFTLIIIELWHCRQELDDGTPEECLLVKGRPLFEREDRIEKSVALAFNAEKTHV